MTPTPTPSSASQAWRAIRSLLLEGEGHRQVQRACAAAGLTPGLLKVALFLSKDQDQPYAMRDLAQHFSCDASYITSVVDGLEQAGVAERRAHPSDRRVKTVLLTEHGVDVLGRVREIIDEAPDAFGVLSEAEQDQLCALLARVAAAAEGVRGEATTPVG